MDELTEQLKALGQASEAAVAPVTAGEVLERGVAPVLDLDAQQPNTASPSRNPRRRLIVGAAAAFVAIAVGSAVFVGQQNPSPAPDFTLAAQTDNAEPFAVPSDDNGWGRLRFCESTDTYDIDTGNTFYGAYQFTREYFRVTGENVGLDPTVWSSPAVAPPEIQDAIANQIYLDKGADPWPICGRNIRGPMITPVVPQWIGQSGGGAEAIIFIEPGVSDARVDEIRRQLSEIFPTRITSTMTFVDAEAAYAEFQEMNPEDAQNVTENVTESDMPESFRVDVTLNADIVARIRAIDDVFSVVTPNPQISFEQPPPMKLHIPALGLQTPIFAGASLENLALGPAVLAGNAHAPVIAGYGSVAGSVFARLGELRPGDEIIVTFLMTEQGTRTEIVRTYEVDPLSIDPIPTSRPLDTLPRLGDIDHLGLMLVSDVVGDPTRRLLIQTRLADPDFASYGIDPTD